MYNIPFRTIIVKIAVTISLCYTIGSTQSSDDEMQISMLRKELLKIQEERLQIENEIDKDREEFKAYREYSLQKMRKIKEETDSIQQQVFRYRIIKDSLQAVIHTIKQKQNEYELLQNSFRSQIVRSTETIQHHIQQFSPQTSEKLVSALSLLHTELQTKSIDNSEGFIRLLHIARNGNELSSTIEIVQRNSPIPHIRGTVYTLRLGTFFEACVTTNGTQAALWNGWHDKQPQWIAMSDPHRAALILKAINVREGKALPEIVSLPFPTMPLIENQSR